MTPEGDEELWHRSSRQKPSRGRSRGGSGSHDYFPGDEISIAVAVGEMVCAFWRLPILPLYILQTTFSRTDSDDVYHVTAAAPWTSCAFNHSGSAPVDR